MSVTQRDLRIQEGFRKCSGAWRGAVYLMIAIYLMMGIPMSQAAREENVNHAIRAIDDGIYLSEGLLRANGAWEKHPILAVALYVPLHQGILTFVMALIVLAPGREPTRRQISIAFWVGLLLGVILWLNFWGYARYGWFVLVLFWTTFAMNSVCQYTKTGSALIKNPRLRAKPASEQQRFKRTVLRPSQNGQPDGFAVSTAPVTSTRANTRPVESTSSDVIRNCSGPEVCPCGSGKPYELCHGRGPSRAPLARGSSPTQATRDAKIQTAPDNLSPPVVPGAPDRKDQLCAQARQCGCGFRNKPGNAFCNGCGKPLEPAQIICPRCNKAIPMDVNYCVHCGSKIERDQTS